MLICEVEQYNIIIFLVLTKILYQKNKYLIVQGILELLQTLSAIYLMILMAQLIDFVSNVQIDKFVIYVLQLYMAERLFLLCSITIYFWQYYQYYWVLYRYNYLISKEIREYSKRRQILYGKLMQELMDLLEGFIEIKMTNSEKHFERKFMENNIKLNKCEMKNEHLKALLSSTNNMFSNINNIGIMAVGLYMVLKGYTSIGIVVLIIMLQGNASYLFQNYSEFLSGLSNTLPSARRIFEVFELDTEKESDEFNKNTIQNQTGEVILEKLSFGYIKENELFKNLNITVTKGQYIGILGESGSGKSTLVKILLGFYPPVQGNYYINGINTKNLTINQIRSQIAYLDQESHLFNLTIEKNVRLGNNKASMEEIIEACKKAGAHEFIMKLPHRYQTVINKTGDNISGGQKQRIALARMFISNRPILLIDEGTSNLDKASEQIVMDAVLSMKGKKTIIMVTHKAHALKDSDCIYTLKNYQLCTNSEQAE